MQNKLIPLAMVIIICTGNRMAAQFHFGAEFRPRTELRHGYNRLIDPAEDPAFFTSQRTRLNLGHTADDFSIGVSVQDIRVWGEVPQLVRTGTNTNVHEAWAELNLSTAVSLKVGRQEIVYDDHRIFGNVDWVQQGRSHDAAVIRWSPPGELVLHSGFAFNQESERITGTVYNLNNYKTFQYIWLNNRWDDMEASFLFLNNGFQYDEDRTVFSQTTGGRFIYNTGDFGLFASAYLQTGRDPADRSLSAHYLAAEISRRSGNISIQAGFELLSGTDQSDMQDPASNFNHSFNPLFGTNHKFNGHMDYFYVGRHFNNVGLRDLYGGFIFNSGAWDAGFRLHGFFSDALLDDPAAADETMPRYLGTELDIYAGFALFNQASLRAGYSQMFASPSMEVLTGGSRHELNNWAWVMLILRPVFF